MGNRCAIRVGENPTSEIYLHWNGGPESVVAFVEYAAQNAAGCCDKYFLARLTQVIGNWMGGNMSLGIYPVGSSDGGDNGIYHVKSVVQVDGSRKFEIVQHRGKMVTATWAEDVKKHPYWSEPHEEHGNIWDQVCKANDAAFKRK